MKTLLILVFLIMVPDFIYSQWSVIDSNDNGSLNHQDLFFTNKDTGIVIGFDLLQASGYIMRTTNGGDTWTSTYFPDYIMKSVCFTNNSIGYIAFIKNNILKVLATYDGGLNWQTINDSIAQINPTELTIKFYNSESGIISVSGASWSTLDSGVNWNLVTNNPNGGERGIDTNDSIYAGTSSGFLIYSYNYGASYDYSYIIENTFSSEIELYEDTFILSATAQDGGTQQFPSYNYARLAIGNIFDMSYSELAFPDVHTFTDIEKVSNDILYAVIFPVLGLDTYFLKSIDGGYSWYTQSTYMSDAVPYTYLDNLFCLNDSICYVAYSGRIYKTTNGGGPLLEEVTQVPLSVAEIKDEPNFSMAPNPTTGGITIKSEKVQIKRLEVFDLQGKSVLTNFPQAFVAKVDLTAFPAGVYLVQVLAGDKILSGKIVVE